MPVRRVIHSESTPIRSAIGPFGTTRSGSLWPRPSTRAVRSSVPRGLRAVVAGEVRLGMDGLLTRRLDLRARDDPLGQPREHLARADLDEPLGAGRVQRAEGLTPADGPDERLRELLAHVGERPRGGAGVDGEARLAQLHVLER